MKTLIAIDPGKTGGIAIMRGSKILTFALSEGDEATRQLLAQYQNETNAVAYVEKVGGFIPKEDGEGQPGSRMFVFGDCYGYVRGLLAAFGIKTVFVVPQMWQRGISGKKGSYSARKKALHMHAKRLFPDLEFTKAEADALGILHYARHVEGLPCVGYSVPIASNPDDSAAVAWAKSQGWPVPAYGSREHADMVRYWATHVRNVA